MTRFFALCGAVLSASLVAAQSPPPRDQPVREGTALLSGVITAENGQPIPRAAVALGGTIALTVIADANGAFTFDRLPAGQFTLAASKTGFLPLAYGQTSSGRGSGLPIDLKDAQRLTDLRWTLPRAGSISGRILDHVGRPYRNAVVTLQQRRSVDGEFRLVGCCGNATADADGHYRITGLPPGDYLVSALPVGDYRFIPEVLSSSGNEMRQTTEEEVRWALRLIETGAAVASGASQPPEPARGSSVSYGRIYFPGTSDASRAAVVPLKSGEERSGADLSMQLLRTSVVRGRVLMPDGSPAANASFAFSDGWSTAGTRLGADGVFERRNLLPGKYTATARASTGQEMWGSREFVLDGNSELDAVISLAPAASVSGRVVFEPGETPPGQAALQVSMPGSSTNSGLTVAKVAADGTFVFPNVDPGRYRLSLTIPAASRGTWTLKSAIVAGVDAADVPFVVSAGQRITDAVITFTTKATRLMGTLLTAADAPAGGYYVVVFADDPSLWVAGSRRMPQPARAATDGRFMFAGLPAGAYRLAALTSVDAADLSNPEFLASLKTGALLVTLADGESKAQDVKFARGR